MYNKFIIGYVRNMQTTFGVTLYKIGATELDKENQNTLCYILDHLIYQALLSSCRRPHVYLVLKSQEESVLLRIYVKAIIPRNFIGCSKLQRNLY